MRGRLLPPRVQEPSVFETREYRDQPGTLLTGANEAYARGITGAGQKIVVVDSKITEVTELTGKIAAGGFDLPSDVGTSADFDHGTFVATVIAGRKNEVGTHGVAYNAQIIPVTIFNTDGDFDTGSSSFITAMARINTAAAQNGARVVNHSWGADSDGQLGGNGIFRQLVDSYSQAIANGIVSVWAAGNEGFAQPSPEAQVPATYPQLEAGWLAVMGIDSATGARWADSNACGVAANWCIGAPATGIIGQVAGNDFYRGNGTSFSTAIVSGALALMFETWPNLTADQARQILFLTADDLGDAGTDAIYGRGALNIARVFSPVGTTTLAGHGAEMAATGISPLDGPVGDAVERGVTGHGVGVIDGFARDFLIPAGAFVGSLDDIRRRERFAASIRDLAGPTTGGFLTGLPGPDGSGFGQYFFTTEVDGTLADEAGVGARLRMAGGMLSFSHGGGAQGMQDLAGLTGTGGMRPAFAGMAHPFMTGLGEGLAVSYRGVLEAGWTLAVTAAGAPNDRSGAAAAATLAWRGMEGLDLAFSVGMVRERETFMGAELFGGFEGAATDSRFASIQAGYSLVGGMSLAVEAHLGTSERGHDPGSLLEQAEMVSTAFGLGLSQEDVAGGTLTAALRQPLRAESGRLGFALPTGTGVDRFTAAAEPSGRQLDLSLGWARHDADGTMLALGVTQQFDAGHVEGEQATLVGVRYGVRF